MRYTVVIERTRGGYSAYVPDLPGCEATGRTRAVVQRRIEEAVAFHLDGLREDGLRIPRPEALAGWVDAPAQAQRRRKSA